MIPEKDSTVLVYCRSGNRSAAAARELADLGYTRVFDLGGIVDWNGEKVAGTEPGSFAGDAQ